MVDSIRKTWASYQR